MAGFRRDITTRNPSPDRIQGPTRSKVPSCSGFSRIDTEPRAGYNGSMSLDIEQIRREVAAGQIAYIDSETCGFHSMMVLWQFAIDDGPIYLYNVWKEPVWKTLELFELLMQLDYCGFNLSFDHFHVAKIYTIWRLLPPDWIPEEHIEEIAMLEAKGQDGPCIKPKRAMDLLLHSRTGKFQALMARDDIRINKVPTVLAYALRDILEERIQIDGIFFARSKDKDAPKWTVYDKKDRDGNIDLDFKDVVLKFNPAGGLKFLAEYVLGLEPKYNFTDVEPPRDWRPIEFGFAPTALAVSSPEKNWEYWKYDNKQNKDVLKGHAWPHHIAKHIEWWAKNEPARDYARDDIVYTRKLHAYFEYPEPGDDNSELACMVGVVRWHGYEINIEGMKELHKAALDVVNSSPVNINKPSEVREYISAAMDEMEAIVIQDSTRKAVLKGIVSMNFEEEEHGDVCSRCSMLIGEEYCARCDGKGTIDVNRFPNTRETGNHPAAQRAREILNVKQAAKEVELYSKLLLAGKFHASFNVVGALSSRMSGGDGLNAQGIKATKEVRKMFPLAWDGMILSGGDFDSFEVTLADAVYNDHDLREALLQDKKIHALFGMAMYPGVTYEEVIASDGATEGTDMYTQGKSGVFGMIYGGDWNTLVRNFGIPEEVAKASEERFFKQFPGIRKARQKTFDSFCSMRQPGGIGSQVIWRDPAPYVETFLGFRRYFHLENQICRELFGLARKPPKGWLKHPVKVARRDRIQSAGGAVQSALYGAAFAIQAQNMRSAANHEIQSPGAEITKRAQRRIWDLQPAGVHKLLVAPMNVHDELMVVNDPSVTEAITVVVRETVEYYRPQVPLIGITWYRVMGNWAGKKGGGCEGEMKVEPPEKIERRRQRELQEA